MHYLEIDNVKYPFKFGVREFMELSSGLNIDTVDEAYKEVSVNFDSFLRLFHLASVKGVKWHARDNGETADQFKHLELSEEKIEYIIDEDPDVLFELQEMFENSNVLKKINEGGKKKTKNP